MDNSKRELLSRCLTQDSVSAQPGFSFPCRHGHVRAGAGGQAEDGQAFLRLEGHEHPGRHPPEAGAARAQREVGPEGS